LQLELFGETPLSADKEVEFYKHEMGWANRLILGDSLLVMNSLLVKEGMAGKVQMIYMDPPYGIKYSSNFQPRIDRRDVKDKDEDLTHEPEQIMKCAPRTEPPGVLRVEVAIRDGSAEGGAG